MGIIQSEKFHYIKPTALTLAITIASIHWKLSSTFNVCHLTMSPISLILVASLTLVGFNSETTLALDSGLDNGLQTVEDRGIDCNVKPNSMNGLHFPKGCPGAVWSGGEPSMDYCTNTGYADGKYPWYAKCCWWGQVCRTCAFKCYHHKDA